MSQIYLSWPLLFHHTHELKALQLLHHFFSELNTITFFSPLTASSRRTLHFLLKKSWQSWTPEKELKKTKGKNSIGTWAQGMSREKAEEWEHTKLSGEKRNIRISRSSWREQSSIFKRVSRLIPSSKSLLLISVLPSTTLDEWSMPAVWRHEQTLRWCLRPQESLSAGTGKREASKKVQLVVRKLCLAFHFISPGAFRIKVWAK